MIYTKNVKAQKKLLSIDLKTKIGLLLLNIK